MCGTAQIRKGRSLLRYHRIAFQESFDFYRSTLYNFASKSSNSVKSFTMRGPWLAGKLAFHARTSLIKTVLPSFSSVLSSFSGVEEAAEVRFNEGKICFNNPSPCSVQLLACSSAALADSLKYPVTAPRMPCESAPALRSSFERREERASSSTLLPPSWERACERAVVSFLTLSLEATALPWAMRWTAALARVSEAGWK